MSAATTVDAIETTIQKTYEWLDEIDRQLGSDDRREAYLALRGTLHALRDHFVVDECAQFAAQLPLLVRGVYYDGWDPSDVPLRERNQEAFLNRVAGAFERVNPNYDPAMAARAVFATLTKFLSPGESEKARHLMPEAIRELWS